VAGPQGPQGPGSSVAGPQGPQGPQGSQGPGGVSGNPFYIAQFTGTTTLGNSSMSQSGNNITVNSGNMTATAFFESSDSRLKTITSRTTSSDGIDFIEFVHNEDTTNRHRLGYTAQDVAKVIPSAVTIDKGYMKVDYKDVHTFKIMELAKRIEELERIIKSKI
jgi:hypothetical protein